jgi:hypothetical protein
MLLRIWQVNGIKGRDIMDMEIDAFAEYSFGKAALSQMGVVSENFRLYEAGWISDRPADFKVIKVTGAEFRRAKTGKNKGLLSIMIKGTRKIAYVTKDEIRSFDT